MAKKDIVNEKIRENERKRDQLINKQLSKLNEKLNNN